jgi:hypothetical protein
MPPPAAAVVAFDQSVDAVEPLVELPLLHPAASTTPPRSAAMAATVFFFRTFPPQTCMTTWVRDARIVARECKGEISIKQIRAVRFMNGSGPEEEFLYQPLAVIH